MDIALKGKCRALGPKGIEKFEVFLFREVMFFPTWSFLSGKGLDTLMEKSSIVLERKSFLLPKPPIWRGFLRRMHQMVKTKILGPDVMCL